MNCELQVGEELLPKVEFTYLGVLLISERKMEWEINRQNKAVLGVWSDVVKRELSRKAMLLIYLLIYVLNLI